MLRCLTKSKVDCSFQNNEFRFKNGGFTQFFFFGFLSFFFHFFGLHWMKLRNSMLKIMGFFFGKEREKKKKKHSSYGRKKIKKKKARTGFEPAIFGSIDESSKPPLYETDALPLGHRATTHVAGWN